MIKKSNRLSTKDFNEIFSNNNPLHNEWFIFLADKSAKFDNRFAVSATKKKYKRRVDRNKIRRFFYNSIRECLERQNTGGIFLVKNGALEMIADNPGLLRNEIIKALNCK